MYAIINKKLLFKESIFYAKIAGQYATHFYSG